MTAYWSLPKQSGTNPLLPWPSPRKQREIILKMDLDISVVILHLPLWLFQLIRREQSSAALQESSLEKRNSKIRPVWQNRMFSHPLLNERSEVETTVFKVKSRLPQLPKEQQRGTALGTITFVLRPCFSPYHWALTWCLRRPFFKWPTLLWGSKILNLADAIYCYQSFQLSSQKTNKQTKKPYYCNAWMSRSSWLLLFSLSCSTFPRTQNIHRSRHIWRPISCCPWVCQGDWSFKNSYWKSHWGR